MTPMQNPLNPKDRRVQRTQMLLRQALFELTIDKGFAAVSVRDIANRAMVNRSTFYRHYLDKFDLLNQYLDELQTLVAETAAVAEQTASDMPDGVPQGLLVLVQHVQQNAAFYRVMLGMTGDPSFVRRFRQFSENRYRYLLTHAQHYTDSSVLPFALRLSYISYAAVGAIQWWLENGQPTSAEQFSIWLSQLSMTSAGLTSTQPEPSDK